ncbi:hypothetical protein BB560_004439, partial [Smittium megazygosporum]
GMSKKNKNAHPDSESDLASKVGSISLESLQRSSSNTEKSALESLNFLAEPHEKENVLFDLLQKSCLNPQPQFPKSWNPSFQRGMPFEMNLNEFFIRGFETKPWMTVKWKRDFESNLVLDAYEEEEYLIQGSVNDLKPAQKSQAFNSTEDNLLSLEKSMGLEIPSTLNDPERDINTDAGINTFNIIDALNDLEWADLWENIQDESKYFKVAPGLDYGLLDESEKSGEAPKQEKTSFSYSNKPYNLDEIQKKYSEDSENKEVIAPTQPIQGNVEAPTNNSLPDTDEDIALDDDMRIESQSLSQVAQANTSLLAGNMKKHEMKWAVSVDLTKGIDHINLDKKDYPLEFGFELDPFQKEAVWHLEHNESVFVAAHTSAGKTAVAEYAIALSKKHMTKTIYTSPIKALSNQKYRDFCKKFGTDQVGIITGDIQIHPEAKCLVMTTEVLRNMLYRGSNVLNDVEFVIFDEVHYVSDLSRGVVWEEVLIMLPEYVTLVLLSATVPNTLEFSEWIGRMRKTTVYVISTLTRPVPLEHFLYLPGKSSKDPQLSQMENEGFYKIVGKDSTFNSNSYRKALADINPKNDSNETKDKKTDSSKRGEKDFKQKRPQDSFKKTFNKDKFVKSGQQSLNVQSKSRTYIWGQLITKLKKLDLLPCVFFVFSRKKCEEYSLGLSNIDFLNKSEKSRVHTFIKTSLSRLSENDMKLPQISIMTDLLLRGIGTHHSGLLPIFKEIVELLFSNNLVKVLFATETFAMGVNMPTRSVVFTSLRKNDGTEFRDLTSSEYIQMSGRAGRRGIDNVGIVIIAVSGTRLEDSSMLNSMILGSSNKLESRFKLSYTMVLNLLISKQLAVEDMIKKSFSENSTVKAKPEKLAFMKTMKEEIQALPELDCMICKNDLNQLYDISLELVRINFEIYKYIILGSTSQQRSNYNPQSQQSRNSVFTKGRLLIINCLGLEYLPVFYVQSQRQQAAQSRLKNLNSTVYKFNNVEVVSPSDLWATVQLVTTEANAEKVISFITNLLTSNVDISFNSQVNDCPPPIPLLNSLKALENHKKLLIDSPNLKLVTLDIPISFIVEISDVILRDAINSIDKHTSSMLDFLNSAIKDPELLKIDLKKTIKSYDFVSLLSIQNSLLGKVGSYQCTMCTDFPTHLMQVHNLASLKSKYNLVKESILDSNLELIPDYLGRLCVLQELGYLDSNRNVTLKGRVASQFNTCDPLVITELILENTLFNYNEYEIAAILSGFVCKMKQSSNVLSFDGEKMEDLDFPEPVMDVKEKVNDIVSGIRAIEQKFGVQREENEVDDLYNTALSRTVYKWAQGTSFYLLSEVSGNAQEGIITRTILRLNENLQEVAVAAKLVGNFEFAEKIKNTITLIKRDIVFVSSLYY